MTAINPKAIRGPVTAVPVVAGKGVRLVQDVENNRVVAEVDETVLFDGNGTPTDSASLSESPFNFEKILVVFSETGTSYECVGTFIYPKQLTGSRYATITYASGLLNAYLIIIRLNVTENSLVVAKEVDCKVGFDSGDSFSISRGNATFKNCIYKVIGLNRIANS